MAPNKKSF